MDYNDVLSFWFKEIDKSQWWVKDPAFDALITKNFADLHRAANQGELFEWRKTAHGRLAEVIILDQFSRNMYRDTPQAFSSDALALVLAQEAIALHQDTQLTQEERSFLYMPFMHSESLKIHNVAVKLYEKNGMQSSIDFEIKHKKIIEKFGRYPHRNAILGRTSTTAEAEFLTQPDSSF